LSVDRLLFFFQSVLGKKIRRLARLDSGLNRELLALAEEGDAPYQTVTGKTLCKEPKSWETLN